VFASDWWLQILYCYHGRCLTGSFHLLNKFHGTVDFICNCNIQIFKFGWYVNMIFNLQRPSDCLLLHYMDLLSTAIFCHCYLFKMKQHKLEPLMACERCLLLAYSWQHIPRGKHVASDTKCDSFKGVCTSCYSGIMLYFILALQNCMEECSLAKCQKYWTRNNITSDLPLLNCPLMTTL
jgi:hypothetical protein